jgi:hypothetical protein
VQPQPLDGQIIQKLQGGRAKTDVELISELGMPEKEIDRAITRLKRDQLIVEVTPKKSPERIFTLKQRPKEYRRSPLKELRTTGFVDRLRRSGWLD